MNEVEGIARRIDRTYRDGFWGGGSIRDLFWRGSTCYLPKDSGIHWRSFGRCTLRIPGVPSS